MNKVVKSNIGVIAIWRRFLFRSNLWRMTSVTIRGVWWPRARNRSPSPCKMLIIPTKNRKMFKKKKIIWNKANWALVSYDKSVIQSCQIIFDLMDLVIFRWLCYLDKDIWYNYIFIIIINTFCFFISIL